jgi:hypothetical protein
MELEQFGGCQPSIKAEVFGKKTDFPPNADVVGRRSENKGAAPAGPDQAEEHLDGSTFARTVGSKEAKDLATGHGQGEVADRYLAPEYFREVLRFDGKVIRLIQVVSSP